MPNKKSFFFINKILYKKFIIKSIKLGKGNKIVIKLFKTKIKLLNSQIKIIIKEILLTKKIIKVQYKKK